MNQVFPFGFPWPTALYLTLFVVTATIYMVFMQYVLGGGIVLLTGAVAPGARRRFADRHDSPPRSGLSLIVAILRDWMPAMLGLAITAGVGPLLFLQVLYRHAFYTANLLLFHRFMLLLPALIVAYYLLYLVKSRPLAARGAAVRVLMLLATFGCFSYTAWAWTENHILSLHQEEWRQVYASGQWVYRNAEIWLRLGFWIAVSLPSLAVVLACQLHWGRRFHDARELELASHRLRALALLGLAMSAVEAWLWLIWVEPSARGHILGILALPYGLLACAGMVIQAAGWWTVKSASDLGTRRPAVMAGGMVGTIVGALVVREARRLAAIDITTLYDAHRSAASVGGREVFLVFLAINTVVIITCVRIVQRALRPIP
jgi:hypothetical protein